MSDQLSVGPETAARQEQATLGRELGELLIQLSIAVHRFAMYPPGHPSLQPAAENVMERLGKLMVNRENLAIGVAQEQLIIEGVATDEKHPVLRDLAKRLHDHQLGAISIDKMPQLWQLEDMLATLAMDADESEKPLGLLPKDEIPDWTHIHLFGIGYSQLRLKDGAGAGGSADEDAPPAMDRATELWLGLARSALADDADALDAQEMPSGGEVAQSIRKNRKDAAYDQVIVGYLLQLTQEMKSGAGSAAMIRDRISELVDSLDEETLAGLVRMGGDTAQRNQFLMNASESLAADSVVKVLKAAASSEEQSISNSMTRLLSKLAVHAESGGGHVKYEAEGALKENVEELIADWELKDPNPDGYTLILDDMARAVPIRTEYQEADTGGLSGAQRIVEMALEIDAFGPIVHKAVSDVMAEGNTGFLIDAIEEAPEDSIVASRMRGQMTNPTQLRKLLDAESADLESLSRLVDRMGEAAIDPLLDVLAESDSRSVRRVVFDILAGREEEFGDRVVARLEDSRWFVLRNLLALIQSFEKVPEGFDVTPYLNHSDARVRREAFPVALRTGDTPVRTLAAALSDDDERMVRMALAEMEDVVPDSLVPTAVNRVVKGPHSEEVRVAALRMLGGVDSNLVLETVLDLTTAGTTFLGRVKLAPSGRLVHTALRLMNHRWGDDDRVKKVLAEARKSKDPEIQRAARAAKGSE